MTQQSKGCVEYDSLKVPHLIMTKTRTLLEVFDHLLDLPSFGIVLDDN